MTPLRRRPVTAVTVLVYWLLVLCGLEGLTVVRAAAGDPHEISALWAGTLIGVALGQLFGWLRLRVWLLAPVVFVALWGSPLFYYALREVFGDATWTFVLALLPAGLCGLLSLSERGGFGALWFPTVLWMVFILDGRAASASTFHARDALPFVVGLAALFVVFLRVRESRRVAIWQSHGSARLAEPRSRTVLRASPVRAGSELAWSAFVGGAALVLAAWVAPHLWQREHGRRPPAPPPATGAGATGAGASVGMGATRVGPPCCPAARAVGVSERVVVREYLPLAHGVDTGALDRDGPAGTLCTPCQDGVGSSAVAESVDVPFGPSPAPSARSSGSGASTPGADDATDGRYATTPYAAAYPLGSGGAEVPSFGTDPSPWPPPSTPRLAPAGSPGMADSRAPPVVPAPPPVAPLPVTPLPVAPLPVTPLRVQPRFASLPPPPPLAPSPLPLPRPLAPVSPPPALGLPPPPSPAASPSPSPASSPADLALAPTPAAPLGDAGPPLRGLLALAAAGLALFVAARGLRRALTLRHLARPFWPETLDQRVSNHWQRALVGLRDAGIHPSSDEQPRAFAERVGIAEMATCATVLERVRHGVRVDASDLRAMDAAASAVYRAARSKAGLAGRVVAWLRGRLD